MHAQLSLFGRGPPIFAHDRIGAIHPRRHHLDDTAWIDHGPGFIRGHEALLEHLLDVVTWKEQRRQMFDRVVVIPRLLGKNVEEPIPILEGIRSALTARYGVDFDSLMFALYRDGKDSVAWHGDRGAREARRSHVVTISLGTPRRFLLRPRPGHRGHRRAFDLGWGDLMVMGGSCQRTWEHAVTKVTSSRATTIGPRLVIMFRASKEWEDLDVNLRSDALPERDIRRPEVDALLNLDGEDEVSAVAVV